MQVGEVGKFSEANSTQVEPFGDIEDLETELGDIIGGNNFFEDVTDFGTDSDDR